jgi:hypothetical protein
LLKTQTSTEEAEEENEIFWQTLYSGSHTIWSQNLTHAVLILYSHLTHALLIYLYFTHTFLNKFLIHTLLRAIRFRFKKAAKIFRADRGGTRSFSTFLALQARANPCP